MKTHISQAVQYLNAGKLVAFPTDTVYGLGADAENAEALADVYRVKGRPLTNPLIILVADRAQAKRYAHFNLLAQTLAAHFWPGPLTLILPKTKSVPDIVTAGKKHVAVRIPNNPTALALLKAFGRGIVAPSANCSGALSPTTSTHVRADLGASVDMILESEHSLSGIESTLLDCTTEQPVILRTGMISMSAIEKVIGMKIRIASTPTSARVVRLETKIPLQEIASEKVKQFYLWLTHQSNRYQQAVDSCSAALIASTFSKMTQYSKIALLVWSQPKPVMLPDAIDWVIMPDTPAVYAQSLYSTLHTLELKAYDAVYVERLPTAESWAGIAERLQRMMKN